MELGGSVIVILAEAAVLCALFTLGVGSTVKDPIKDINNYPPAIIERCAELGLITDEMKPGSKQVKLKKLLAAVAFLLVFAAVIRFFNNASGFLEGFAISYLLWTIVDWYDAIVLDCLWFCHSRRVIIPGTEDMVSEYKNYRFHLLGSLRGMLIGLPVCLATATLVHLLP